jgi:hypothetical protein
MSFSGSEIAPKPNPAGTSMWLEESNQSGQTPTNWVSHPSGIGYRRSSPGVTTWNGSTSSTSPPIPGNAPTMDSGTTDGGIDQELNRLGNFINGGNENPTSTQPGPTPRAQQLAMPSLPIGSPAAVNMLDISNPMDRDNIGNVMKLQENEGKWGPYANPLYHPPGTGAAAGGNAGQASSPSGGPAGGRMGSQGYGYGGGMTGPDGLVPGTGPVAPGAPPAEPSPGSQVPPPQDDGGRIIGADDHPGGGTSWDEPEKGTAAAVGDYVLNSATQIVMGNYTADEDRTWLGTGGEIGVGFVPYVSTVASARDLTFDLSHWKWTWGHALQTTGDAVGLIPFARGFVKSAGAVSRTVRGAGKAATAGLEAGQAAKALTKNAGEVGDAIKRGAVSRNPTDRLAQHVTVDDLSAAAKEANTGVPYRGQHLREVRDAARGLRGRIDDIMQGLENPNLAPDARAALTDELGKASKLLDAAETAVKGSFQRHGN